jgi:DNA-binding NtrC family response regulator
MSNSRPNPARVLIVEDDVSQSELLTRIAHRCGCETVRAHSGEQALSILREAADGIDLVVTDIRLSGLVDGWVVGTEFTLRHPLRPVIYVSGVEQDASFRRSVGSHFLRKPVNVADLSALFRRLQGTAPLGRAKM